MIIADTQIDFKRYLKLMYLLTYRKKMMILLSFIGVLFITLSIAYFLGFNSFLDEPPYFQLFFGIFCTIILPVSVYLQAKKNFSTSGRLQERIVYGFTEEKIFITGESFKSELTWNKTYKVEVLKNWILIYQNNHVANLIPKESLNDKLEEFKELIRNKTKVNLK